MSGRRSYADWWYLGGTNRLGCPNAENRGIYYENLYNKPSTGNNNSHFYAIYKNVTTDKANYKDSYINNVYICYCNIGIHVNKRNFRVNILNSDVKFCLNECIRFDSTDSTISNCYLEGSQEGSGLSLLSGNNKVSNIKSIFNGKDNHYYAYGIQVGGYRNQLINCETQDNYGIGYYVTGHNNMLIGCYSNSDCYAQVPEVYDATMNPCGFVINSDNSVITNCFVSNYNINIGECLFDSPYRVVNPNNYIDIKWLPLMETVNCKDFPKTGTLCGNPVISNVNRIDDNDYVEVDGSSRLFLQNEVTIPKTFAIFADLYLRNDNNYYLLQMDRGSQSDDYISIRLDSSNRLVFNLFGKSIYLNDKIDGSGNVVDISQLDIDQTAKIRVMATLDYKRSTQNVIATIAILYKSSNKNSGDISIGYKLLYTIGSFPGGNTVQHITRLYFANNLNKLKLSKVLITDNPNVLITSDISKLNQLLSFDSDNIVLNNDNYLVGTQRPTRPYVGMCVFDTSINKPIWWKGSDWVDATGTTV